MADLFKLFRFVRHMGMRMTIQTIIYALKRDRMEARSRGLGEESWHSPGPVLPQPLSTRPFELSFGEMSLRIEFLTEDILRLTWSPGADPPDYALAQVPMQPQDVDIRQDRSQWLLRGKRLHVIVSDAGEVTVRELGGTVLRADQPPARRGDAWSLRTALTTDEHIFGLGERSSGPDLRPGRYRLWNTDPPWSYGPRDDPLYMNIPVMLHVGNESSHLVFFENPHDGQVELGGESTIQFAGGALRYYVIAGPPDRALSRYMELTGRPSMPPRWALGFHQSRWGYKSADQIRAIARGFHDRGLPLQAIHLDIDYMDEYRVFSIDQADFPDLRALADELESIGVRLVTILDPGIKWDPGYPIFEDGRSAQVFCKNPDGEITRGVVWPGWAAYPDFTSPNSRQWWGDHYQALLEMGISGFWHDMNEPVSFAAWGDTTLPLPTRHAFDGRPGDHRQGHNLYALQMNRAGYEALRRLVPNRRPWIVSRSGWAGNQRFAWNWTGDTQSTWEALRMTVATVIGLSLSGIYFSGPDAGGFSGTPSPELFTRWFQLAALLPFFRVHSSINSQPREPWLFDDETQSIVKKYLQLRMELMPYFYTLAARAADHGEPLVRPAFWPDGRDLRLLEVDDAYLLGENMLIAPILEKAERSRIVYLPGGSWYSFWTGQEFQGHERVEIQAPIDRIPIFVRAGALLPLWDGEKHVLRIYPPVGPEQHTFSSLYLDDGDGYGPSRWDFFSLERRVDGLSVAHSSEGEYLPADESFGIEMVSSHPEQVSELGGSATVIGTVDPEFRSLIIPADGRPG